jgi:hypothetical protein
MSIHRHLIVLFLLTLCTVVVRLPDINMPLERDEGEYAYAAQEILRGGMPYRDTFCQKPPIIFLWYLSSLILFGQSVWGIHFTMILISALTTWGVYLVWLQLAQTAYSSEKSNFGRHTIGFIVALFFLLSSADGAYFGSAANTEIFMLLPVLFGIHQLIIASETGAGKNWYLFGFLSMAAMLTKQVALFSFIGPVIVIGLFLHRRKHLSVHAIIFAFMGAFSLLLFIFLWMFIGGAFKDFINMVFFHNLDYVGFPFSLKKWMRIGLLLITRFKLHLGLWIASAICLGSTFFKKHKHEKIIYWFSSGWMVSSLFGVALGPYTFGHYFLQLLPPACILSGLLLNDIIKSPKISKRMSNLLAAAVVISICTPIVHSRIVSLKIDRRTRSFTLYSVYGPSPFSAAEEVGEYLNKKTTPDDQILIVGSEPEILFYANRKSATKYTIFYPLTGNFKEADDMTNEFFREVLAKPPKYIILVYCRTSFITGNGRIESIYRRIEKMVREKYAEDSLVLTDNFGKTLWEKTLYPSRSEGLPLFHLFKIQTIFYNLHNDR